MIEQLILGAINGIVWGLIIALIAIGFNLIFGLLNIKNLAHGEFFMLGAITTTILIRPLGDLFFWPSLIIVPMIFFGLAYPIERFLFRPISNSLNATLIVSIGLSYILQQVGLYIFGGIGTRIEFPIGGYINIAGFSYPIYRLFVAFLSSIMLILLWLFLYRTGFGLLIRASRRNKELAMSMGIPATTICAFTFCLGISFAALSGILSMSIMPIHYLMGADAFIPALIAVIVGGLGNLGGSLLAAIIVGEVEGIGAVFFSPTEARILSLLLLIGVLLFRPTGLFGGIRK